MSSVPGKIKAPTFLQETPKAPVDKPAPKVGKVKTDFLNQQAHKVEKTHIDIVPTGKVKTDFLKQSNTNEAPSPNRNTQVKKVALPTFLQGEADKNGSSSSPADHAKPSPKKINNPFLKAEQEKKEKELREKENKRRLAEKHLSPREDEEAEPEVEKTQEQDQIQEQSQEQSQDQSQEPEEAQEEKEEEEEVRADAQEEDLGSVPKSEEPEEEPVREAQTESVQEDTPEEKIQDQEVVPEETVPEQEQSQDQEVVHETQPESVQQDTPVEQSQDQEIVPDETKDAVQDLDPQPAEQQQQQQQQQEDTTPETVTESEPVVESEPVAESEPVVETVEEKSPPQDVTESEPVVEATPEPEVESVAEHTQEEQAAPEPVVDVVPEPADPISGPVAQPVYEPVSQQEIEESSQVEDLNLALQKSHTELEESRAQLAQIKADSSFEIASLKEKQAITEQAISRFGKQVEELISTKESLTQENSILSSKIVELEAQITEQQQNHQQQLTAATAQQPEARQEESGNNEVVEGLQREKTALEQQVADLQSKLNEFVKSNQNIAQSFEGQLSSLEKSLQLSQESEQAAIKRVQYLEHQVIELQRSNQQQQQATQQPIPTQDPTPVHIPTTTSEPRQQEQPRKIEQQQPQQQQQPASKSSATPIQSAPLPPAAFSASGTETRHGVITVIGLDQIKASIKSIFHADAYSGWIIVGYTGAASIALQLSNPTGTVPELVSQLLDDQVQYCLIRIPLTDKFGNKTSRDLLIQWIGPKVSLIHRGKKSSHQKDIMDVVKPFHYDLSATGKRNFTLETLVKISSPNSGSHEISD